ncbi:hypothetical protein VTN49DRAFT_3531 [Thermomyces lanuginosus]|uniref:uncharacterized protein n=1 Tax=Thermomyces lanuginosus TaxID=5541 RepID=UPI003743C594
MTSKRKRADFTPEEDDDASRETKRYAYLEPRVRHIPERTIKSKWAPLPEAMQEKVREMFRMLERPVIVRHLDEKKRIEAQAAVSAVVKNLNRRLPRMPFPPMAKDASFDYESALNERRILETQLSSAMSTIDLLKLEIEREEALLAKETKQVEEMEKNAKRAEMERKRQAKNEHPVLRRLDEQSQQRTHRSSTTVSIADNKHGITALHDVEPDPELRSLIVQLTGHLKSMQNNVGPFAELKDAISEAQAALNIAIPID